jgi:hypothetical protein
VAVVIVIGVIVLLLAAVGFLAVRRRPRQDDGLRSFRRHIDALSPEARREVQERARRHDGASRDEPGNT